MPPSSEPSAWHALPEAPPRGQLLGNLFELQDGHATMLELPSKEQDRPFRYLLLRSSHQVRAYVNRCAHFGVPLANRQALLIFTPHESLSCNVHYAHYRWSDGVCFSGDCAGESLMAIPLHVDTIGQITIALEDV